MERDEYGFPIDRDPHDWDEDTQILWFQLVDTVNENRMIARMAGGVPEWFATPHEGNIRSLQTLAERLVWTHDLPGMARNLNPVDRDDLARRLGVNT